MSHDMNEQGSILELARYRLQVAKEDLETAIDNEKAGHLRVANNKAYYAIYYRNCRFANFHSLKRQLIWTHMYI